MVHRGLVLLLAVCTCVAYVAGQERCDFSNGWQRGTNNISMSYANNMTRPLTKEEIAALTPVADSKTKPVGKIVPAADAGKVKVVVPEVAKQVEGAPTVVPGEVPWIVAIMADNALFCAGSLISYNYVLTAAHCIHGFSQFYVTLAGIVAMNVNVNPSNPTLNRKPHPSFNPNDMTLRHDIGLLKLPTAICDLPTLINTVRLPRWSQVQTFPAPGLTTKVAGWGTWTNGVQALRSLKRTVISNAACAPWFNGGIYSTSVCTKDSISPTTSRVAQLDAGAPLVNLETSGSFAGFWHQAGVVSYVRWDGVSGIPPVVYTRVASYLSWISTNTGINILP